MTTPTEPMFKKEDLKAGAGVIVAWSDWREGRKLAFATITKESPTRVTVAAILPGPDVMVGAFYLAGGGAYGWGNFGGRSGRIVATNVTESDMDRVALTVAIIDWKITARRKIENHLNGIKSEDTLLTAAEALSISVPPIPTMADVGPLKAN